MMKASFAYLAAASILHDGNSVARILGDYEGLLREAGGRPSGPTEAAGLPLVHVVLTGGTEGLVLARAAERLAASPKEPVLLVAHPFHNSLPACLEILARLRRDGVSGRILYLEGPRDLEGAARLSEAARLAEVCAAMGRTRIGAVGAPSDWLVASSQARRPFASPGAASSSTCPSRSSPGATARSRARLPTPRRSASPRAPAFAARPGPPT